MNDEDIKSSDETVELLLKLAKVIRKERKKKKKEKSELDAGIKSAHPAGTNILVEDNEQLAEDDGLDVFVDQIILEPDENDDENEEDEEIEQDNEPEDEIAQPIDPSTMTLDEYCIHVEKQANPEDIRPCHVLYSEQNLKNFQEWASEQRESDTVKSWWKKLALSQYDKDTMAQDNVRKYRIKRMALAQPAIDAIQDLRQGFPHFEDVIGEISDHLLLANRGDKAFSLPPLLMVGPPGTGKTFFFEELSKRVETTYEVLQMEGITAGFAIVGMDTGWHGAAPGIVFRTLMKPEATINPIMLLDEIDKVTGCSNGPVGPVLLPLLETHSSRRFEDNCLHLQIDASRINWVATANVLEKIDVPLRSRFNVVPVANPDYYARCAMARHIYASLRKRNSWGPSFDETMSEESLQTLARPANAARELRKSITRAFATAARHQRSSILPQDIPPPDQIAPHYFWDAPLVERNLDAQAQQQEQ